MHMDREGHFKLLKSTITGVNVFGEENVSEATKKNFKIGQRGNAEKIAFFHFWPSFFLGPPKGLILAPKGPFGGPGGPRWAPGVQNWSQLLPIGPTKM